MNEFLETLANASEIASFWGLILYSAYVYRSKVSSAARIILYWVLIIGHGYLGLILKHIVNPLCDAAGSAQKQVSYLLSNIADGPAVEEMILLMKVVVANEYWLVE